MEYWYLWVVFAVFVVVFLFGAYKAAQSSAKRKLEMQKQIEKIEKAKMLKRDYKEFNPQNAENYDKNTLFEGVAFYLQMYFEKFNDIEMQTEFENMTTQEKYVYTVNCLIEDSLDECLSNFFRVNGEILISLCVDAVIDIFNNNELVDIVKEEYAMFDRESDVSVDYDKLALLDERFGEIIKSVDYKAIGAEYIIKNKNFFEIHK